MPTDYDSILQWHGADAAGFSSVAGELSAKFIEWYNTLNDDIKTQIESTDFTSYTNVDEIFSSLGLSNQTPEITEAFAR